MRSCCHTFSCKQRTFLFCISLRIICAKRDIHILFTAANLFELISCKAKDENRTKEEERKRKQGYWNNDMIPIIQHRGILFSQSVYSITQFLVDYIIFIFII